MSPQRTGAVTGYHGAVTHLLVTGASRGSVVADASLPKPRLRGGHSLDPRSRPDNSDYTSAVTLARMLKKAGKVLATHPGFRIRTPGARSAVTAKLIAIR